jgi:hypothetical protein
VSAALFMDGHRVNKTYIKRGSDTRWKGAQVSGDTVLPFNFSDLELIGAFLHLSMLNYLPTELLIEDADDEQQINPHLIGDIQLKIRRTRGHSTINSHVGNVKKHDSLLYTKISEQSKKSGSHRISYVCVIRLSQYH